MKFSQYNKEFKDIKMNDIIETYEFFEQARKL